MGFLAPLVLAIGAGGGAAIGGASLATGLAVGTTVLTGLSAYQQASYQRAVAKNNAQIANQNAQLASQKAQQDQLRSDRDYRALFGQQLAEQSASGLSTESESFRRVRKNTLRVRGEAAGDIRTQGESEVKRLQQDAANFRGEANAAKYEAFNALAGTFLGIGGDVAKGIKGGEFKSLIGKSRSTRR